MHMTKMNRLYHSHDDEKLMVDNLAFHKPDLHSRFSLVASEILLMGHVQSGETNRTGRKISFALFAFEVQLFQLLLNFQTAKPDFFLSHVGILRGSKNFPKMATPQFHQA